MEFSVTRRSPLQVLARRWWVLLVCALIGAALALAYSSSEAKSYQTTAAIVASPGPKSQNDQYVLQRVPTYPLVLSGNVLLTKVAAQLGPGYSAAQLTGSVTAVNPLNTAVIYVTAAASSPDRSISIVKAVIDNGIATINSLESQRIIASEIMQPSPASTVLASRHRGLYVIAGLVVGLAIGAASALLFEFLAPQRESRANRRRQRSPTEFGDDPTYGAAVASQAELTAPVSSVQANLVDRLMGTPSQTPRQTAPDETASDELGSEVVSGGAEAVDEAVSGGAEAADGVAEDEAPAETHDGAPHDIAPHDIASDDEAEPVGAEVGEAGTNAEGSAEPGPADAEDEADREMVEPADEARQIGSAAPAHDGGPVVPGGSIKTPAIRPVAAANGSKPASAPINGSKPADVAAESTEPADAAAEDAEPADAAAEDAEPTDAGAEDTEPADAGAEDTEPADAAESPPRPPAAATNGASHPTFFDQAWLHDLQKRLELDRPFEFPELPTDPKTPQPAEQADTR